MTINSRHPFLVCLMGCAFAVILGFSILKRITHPSLTVHTILSGQTGQSDNSNSISGQEMGSIGQLMRQAAQNPDNPDVLLKLIENLLAVGQWQAAENFAQKALDINPPPEQNSKIMYLLSLAHHNKGEHQQAAEILEKLLLMSENPSARYSLGILYAHYLNKPDAGLAEFKKGLELPNLAPALERAMKDEIGKLEQKTTDNHPANIQNSQENKQEDVFTSVF